MIQFSKEIPNTIICVSSTSELFTVGDDVYVYTSECNEYEGILKEVNEEKRYIVIELMRYNQILYATVPVDHIVELELN